MNPNDELRKAKEAALRLLALRDRSRKEIEGRLFEKDYTREIVDRVLREMEFLGYIDDARYAFKFAMDAVKRKSAGPAAVKYGLQQKGVPREVIDEAVSRVFQDYDEKEVAQKALKTALRKRLEVRNKKQEIGRNELKRLSDYLRRKGFSYDIIKETLKEIEKEDDI